MNFFWWWKTNYQSSKYDLKNCNFLYSRKFVTNTRSSSPKVVLLPGSFMEKLFSHQGIIFYQTADCICSIEFLKESVLDGLEHSPYCPPELSSCDFWLLLPLKEMLILNLLNFLNGIIFLLPFLEVSIIILGNIKMISWI